MNAEHVKQTEVGGLVSRLLKWQSFATRKAIDLRETRISLSSLLKREAELRARVRELEGRTSAEGSADETLRSRRDSARIRVRRQTGHGYWATITHADGRREAVQSPQIYGFETPKEAREEARRRCAQNVRISDDAT